MNWLFGKNKSNLPEPTALQTQKTKQIEQLKAFNQNVSEIHRDVEYRVNCIINGNTVSFYITLPPQFPQDKPSIKVAPEMRHPWVNEQMIVVGCPGINNFMVHSDLGKVIRQLVEEFQRVPPVLLPQQQPYLPYGVQPPSSQPTSSMGGYPNYGHVSGGSAYMPPHVPMPTLPGGAQLPGYSSDQQTSTVASTAYTSNTQAQIPSNYNTPEIPYNFPQIRDLSKEELQQLSDNEDRLIQIITGLPQMQKIQEDREEICRNNEQIARDNLSKRPILEEKKRLLLEKYELLNEVRRQFDTLSHKQDELRAQYDPNTLQARLKVAALQSEEEAEKIADSFLMGKISVDEFNKSYMQIRKLSHLRKVKEEKLSQFLVHGSGGF